MERQPVRANKACATSRMLRHLRMAFASPTTWQCRIPTSSRARSEHTRKPDLQLGGGGGGAGGGRTLPGRVEQRGEAEGQLHGVEAERPQPLRLGREVRADGAAALHGVD